MKKEENLSNGHSLQTGDLSILAEITGLKYDTVKKVVHGLRRNKRVTKALLLLPAEKAKMIERIKNKI